MRRDAVILLALLCILLASLAASVSTARLEHATYEKVRSALGEARLSREGPEFWPADWWLSEKRRRGRRLRLPRPPRSRPTRYPGPPP
ncbi:unnamed protein product [Spirodela intermedia]|uniref:Uncharacterized protein n=1 Tax=Spirodela intermedia TaxID=51605 RepID=A0A7I8IT32_SPIIN|nr:unnamed protein product [Spirodela intermedia]CAA6661163.1 unnamed protein product [Spirodela intermedia]